MLAYKAPVCQKTSEAPGKSVNVLIIRGSGLLFGGQPISGRFTIQVLGNAPPTLW